MAVRWGVKDPESINRKPSEYMEEEDKGMYVEHQDYRALQLEVFKVLLHSELNDEGEKLYNKLHKELCDTSPLYELE